MAPKRHSNPRRVNDPVFTVIGLYPDNGQTYVQTVSVPREGKPSVNARAKRIAARLAYSLNFEVLFVLEGTIGRIIEEPFYDGRPGS